MNKNYLIALFSLILFFNKQTIFSQTWLPPMGTGITSTNGAVLAVESYLGDVVIAGEFTSVSGVSAVNVAKWNGSSWSALGAGVPDLVKCLVVFNGDLYAGTDVVGSTALYKWTGSAWVSAGPMTSSVNTLYADEQNGILYAGGAFTTPGKYVAKFENGTWSGIGSLSTGTSSFPACYALTKYKDTLYAGGTFSAGSNTQYVAKYNPEIGWVQLHSDKPNAAVNSFTQFRDTLYVGGNFTKVGVQTGANTRWHVGVAKYDTKNWIQLIPGIVGPNTTSGEVLSIEYYNGEIYAAGSFSDIFGGDPNTPKVARFNGTSWQGLETGLNNTGRSLHRIGDTLYVVGSFTTTGSINSPCIGRWYNAFVGCTNPLYTEYHPDVDVSDPNACTDLITDPPVASFASSSTTICANQSIFFNSNSSGNPTSTTWSFPGGNPSSSSNPSQTVVYANPGTYDVILTVTNVAGTDIETLVGYVTVDNCLELNEISLNNYNIYPNPFEDLLEIKNFNNSVNFDVQIMDITGKIIESHNTISKEIKINTSHLMNGVYFVKIYENNREAMFKIMKN